MNSYNQTHIPIKTVKMSVSEERFDDPLYRLNDLQARSKPLSKNSSDRYLMPCQKLFHDEKDTS